MWKSLEDKSWKSPGTASPFILMPKCDPQDTNHLKKLKRVPGRSTKSKLRGIYVSKSCQNRWNSGFRSLVQTNRMTVNLQDNRRDVASPEVTQEAAREAGERQQEQLTPDEASEVEARGAVLKVGGKTELGTMKVDLHCHSEASHDCCTPLELIPLRCQTRGVNVQAITDHNLIWGAQRIKGIVEELAQNAEAGGPSYRAPLTVIIGEEISTNEGELIGLFLEERIESGLSPEETVERIKSQGGLVLLPHGFDPLKRWRLRPEARERIAHSIDIVETFNARISQPRWNRAAVAWSLERSLPISAGTDAHTLADIGSAWVEVPYQPIQKPQDLLRALEEGTPAGQWTHPVIASIYKLWDRTRRRYISPRGELGD
jgi:predicted metal-dependent phosphoesterase TrpH